MKQFSTVIQHLRRMQISVRHETLLFRLSTWVLPVVICLLSLWGLVAWESYYSQPTATTLSLQLLKSHGLKPELALQASHSQPPSEGTRIFSSRLSEDPFWFTFEPVADAGPVSFEFTSRHAVSVACWNRDNLDLLGEADQSHSLGALSRARAGFVLHAAQPPRLILCRNEFVGPARQSVLQWPAQSFEQSAQEFHRNSGLLDGGMLLMAAFVLITALVLRKSVHVLFAVWLIVNLRMGALSAGWDTQWLAHSVPVEWLSQMRLLTVALYYLLTVTLFSRLFKEDLEQAGYPTLLHAAQWTCLPMLGLSVLLPFKTFLPVIWVATGINSAVLVFFLYRILRHKHSRVAMWYSASICVALFASLYEVLSAALGTRVLLGAVNSVTAALASSLLAALAFAEQIRQEQLYRLEVQEQLAHTYSAIPIGLFTLDLNGNFLSVNPAMKQMLGLSSVAGSWRQHFGASNWLLFHDMVESTDNAELDLDGQAGGRGHGRRFHVKATLASGTIEGSLQDITEQAKATADLEFMANNDPLTKVLNRHGLESALSREVLKASPLHPVAMAYLDLDRFKLINDLYGHRAGDEVLFEVCSRVTGMLSGNHQIGRVGGDEFVIIFPDTSISLASWICRGIVDRLCNEPYQIGDKAFQVHASIGLIELDANAPTRDALATADRACREAKEGHDGLMVYEKNASALLERQAERKLVERLSSGPTPEGLFLEMQPIMSLKTPHESLNFEVLLRMHDNDGKTIPAGRIIGAAENSGRTGVIDRWVMQNLLAWLVENKARLPRTQFVCMNLSGASLNDERFVSDAAAMLQQHADVAGRLCIEITESVALRDLQNTRRFIDKVRNQGARVALDDFGAGYTSFSYLKDLPADVLKIDGSFIVNMNHHPANIAIVEAIVSLAMNLGMKTIAEWAEDFDTVRSLVETGVDYVQGFAIARSQAAETMLAAPSAASFIKDPMLAEYVRGLGTVSEAGAPVDFFKYRGLH